MLAQTDRTVQFDIALRTAATAARTRYPDEQGRLDRGLVLALNGHVQLQDDGTALVRSERDYEVRYRVSHQHCDCVDFAHAPEGRCKHRFAACLVRKVTAVVPDEPAPIRWHATYYPDDQRTPSIQGIAYPLEPGWEFQPEGCTSRVPVSFSRLTLGGRLDLTEAQRVADGENLATKHGQPPLPEHPLTRRWLDHMVQTGCTWKEARRTA